MKILLVAATSVELNKLLEILSPSSNTFSFPFNYKKHEIYSLTTGVGGVNTAFALARYKIDQKLDLAIQLGIAGSFNLQIKIGDVVAVMKDRFGDLGSEDIDRSLIDVYENKLASESNFPFQNGWLSPYKPPSINLLQAKSISVNTCSGVESTIDMRMKKYGADIESMEGAAFFYACNMLEIPCIQIRAISNKVEPRNKENWDVAGALKNLHEKVIEIIDNL
jgi:futalosine hydrolase